MTTGVLLSFWYYKTFDMERLAPGVPVIADSGAFSAYTSGGAVDLDEYADWLEAHRHRFRYAFNLDVMGDPQASYRQWERLKAMGHDTVPVIHFGTRPEDILDRYLRHGVSRISLGGIVVKTVSLAQREAWIAYVFRWLRNNAPDVAVHGLGVHMRSRLARFAWAATDSSSFSAAWRFGRLALWDPVRKRWHTVTMDRKHLHRYGRVVRWYGFDPERISHSVPETRPEVVRFATLVECQAARDWNEAQQARAERFLTTKPSVSTQYGIGELSHHITDRHVAPAGDSATGEILDTLGSTDRFLVDTDQQGLVTAAGVADRYLTTTTRGPGSQIDTVAAVADRFNPPLSITRIRPPEDAP